MIMVLSQALSLLLVRTDEACLLRLFASILVRKPLISVGSKIRSFAEMRRAKLSLTVSVIRTIGVPAVRYAMWCLLGFKQLRKTVKIGTGSVAGLTLITSTLATRFLPILYSTCP